MCISLCTTVTTQQHRTVLIIFHLILQTIITAQMMSTGREGVPSSEWRTQYCRDCGAVYRMLQCSQQNAHLTHAHKTISQPFSTFAWISQWFIIVLQENTWRLARPHALPGQSIDVKTSICRALHCPQLQVRTLKNPTNTVGNTNRRMQKIENITKNVAKTPFYILCTAAPRYVSLHLTE